MKPWKILKVTALAIVGVVLLATTVVYAASETRIRKGYDIARLDLAVPVDDALAERGRHLAASRGCTDCHTADLGGQVLMDEPGVARVAASNLTRGVGGIGVTYTDADWDRAIRHGVGPNGRALAIMPSREYFNLSEGDVAALVAYLRTVPPVDREHPPRRMGPIGRALLTVGALHAFSAEEIDHQAARPAAPAEGPTAEYGAYLAALCAGCHGPDQAGGKASGPPGSPASANLTPHPTAGLGAWSEADFFRAMREGRRPDGRVLNPEFMPWTAFQQMTDDELRALWLYLRSVPPAAKG
jgi:cytochrome c553